MAKLMTNPQPRRTKSHTTPTTRKSRPVVVFALPSISRSRDATDPDSDSDTDTNGDVDDDAT